MATLHDFGLRGIVVLDGKRTVAVARRWRNHGIWQLRIYDGSWADTMRNEDQKAHYARLGLRPDVWPFLKNVKTRKLALQIMSDLAGAQHGLETNKELVS